MPTVGMYLFTNRFSQYLLIRQLWGLRVISVTERSTIYQKNKHTLEWNMFQQKNERERQRLNFNPLKFQQDRKILPHSPCLLLDFQDSRYEFLEPALTHSGCPFCLIFTSNCWEETRQTPLICFCWFGFWKKKCIYIYIYSVYVSQPIYGLQNK